MKQRFDALMAWLPTLVAHLRVLITVALLLVIAAALTRMFVGAPAALPRLSIIDLGWLAGVLWAVSRSG